jgi:hypothetical protein
MASQLSGFVGQHFCELQWHMLAAVCSSKCHPDPNACCISRTGSLIAAPAKSLIKINFAKISSREKHCRKNAIK